MIEKKRYSHFRQSPLPASGQSQFLRTSRKAARILHLCSPPTQCRTQLQPFGSLAGEWRKENPIKRQSRQPLSGRTGRVVSEQVQGRSWISTAVGNSGATVVVWWMVRKWEEIHFVTLYDSEGSGSVTSWERIYCLNWATLGEWEQEQPWVREPEITLP